MMRIWKPAAVAVLIGGLLAAPAAAQDQDQAPTEEYIGGGEYWYPYGPDEFDRGSLICYYREGESDFNPVLVEASPPGTSERHSTVCVGEALCRYVDTTFVSVVTFCRPAILRGGTGNYNTFLCPDATTCVNQRNEMSIMAPVKVLEMFDDNLQVLEPDDERREQPPDRPMTRQPDPRRR